MKGYLELKNALYSFREVFKRGILTPGHIQKDIPFFKRIINTDVVNWTVSDANELYNLLHLHRDSLLKVGFDFNRVPKIALEKTYTAYNTDRVVGYDGSSFKIRTPYINNIISDLKIIPGRTYDSTTRVWSVPLSEVVAVRSIISKHKFTVGDQAQKMLRNVSENLEQSYSAERIELDIPLKLRLFDFQTVGVDYAHKNKRIINGDQMGLGKALVKGTPVLTPLGFKPIETLEVGSLVYAKNGLPTKVTGVYPQGVKDIYRITFNDKTFIDTCKEHLWEVSTPYLRTNGGYKVLSTGQMIEQGVKIANGNRKFYLPLVDPIYFEYKDFYIDPYLIGFLIGDGCFMLNSIKFTTADKDLIRLLKDRIPIGFKITHLNRYDYSITKKGNDGLKSTFITELKDLGLWRKNSYNKSIPELYKFGSIDQRKALLSGLLDSDGFINKEGNTIQYSSVSKKLANDVAELVRSLGGVSIVRKKITNINTVAYIVTVKIDFNPFTLERKKKRYLPRTKYKPSKSIDSIKYLGKGKAYCIAVDNYRKLFVTKNYTLTHNTIQGLGGVVINDAYPSIIISPKSLRSNWREEWETWTDKKVLILNHKNVKKLPELIDQKLVDVVITNYEGIKSFFVEEIKEILVTSGDRAGTSYKKVYTNGLERLFKSVVLDEAHNCRNKKTIRYKTIKKVFEDKEVRICLTGTPIVKGPGDLEALLDLIGRIDDFGGAYKFKKAFKGAGKEFVNGGDKNLSPQLRALNIKLRSTCFIRREKHQVLKDLPDKYRKVIKCELTNRKEYDQAYISLQSWLSDKNYSAEQIAKALKAELLVRLGILKKLSSEGKIDEVVEFAENVINEGEKLIIFCWFNDTVERLKKAFPGAVQISGKIDGRDMTDEEVQAAKNKFQNDDKTKVIIVTYKKGGEGHTLTAASKVAFIELGWTYKDQSQAEDRAHRIGQKNNVGCYYFLAEDTIDQDIYDIIDARRRIEKLATGGTEEVATSYGSLIKKILEKT